MMQTITNPPQNHVNPLFDDAGYIRIDSGLGRIHPDEEFVLHRNRYSRDYSPEAEEAREIGERLRLEVCHPLQQDFKTLKELADRKKKCFALGPKLGEGQFSKVYIGMFQGKKMAVKAISMADVGRDYLEHFLPREIDCWQRMEHPNLTRLFGMIQGRNTVIMYSELAPHGDLLRVVQIMGRVGYVRTTFWMSQILRALDYLHTHGIAHRDLKLENCLLFKDEIVKLTDFGFCVEVKDRRQRSTTHCGSRLYSAPEILLNKSYDPFKSDVWSVGVIAAVLINNSMPFYDEPDEMSNAHVIEQQRQRILAPAIYGPSCQETLDALLAFDPVVRPDVHDAMLLPWWRRLTTTRKSLPEQKQDIFDRPMHPLPLLA